MDVFPNLAVSPSVIEGPVEIGMSLDIASIDAISEINMVCCPSHNFFFLCWWVNECVIGETDA